MVQSDIPRDRTQSGKVNVKWYLDRLKTSPTKHFNHQQKQNHFKKINSNSTIRIARGTTAIQGQYIPRVYLKSPTRSFENQQKSFEKRYSSSIEIPSTTSLKSFSVTSKISQLNCQSSQSIENNEKENSSYPRSSSGTLLSEKADVLVRPPSTPVDQRCERDNCLTRNSIQRETCHLLGPQLCSDCIEIQTRSNLSPERLPNQFIRQRLSALAMRHFIPNEQYLTEEYLLELIHNQQNQSNQKYSKQILSDKEYFNRLQLSLNQHQNKTPFYFQNFKDFTHKYQTNKYPRLFLSETPIPYSSNTNFNQSSFEKFDISSKYSFMKKASTIKPNLKSNTNIFISPKQSEQFYQQHNYLINYSPPLLKQTTINNSNKYFNLSSNQISKHSLINSKSSS